MILEKFLGNSSKKVTMIGESGEIPHFCFLVNQYLIDFDTVYFDNRDEILKA